MSLCALIYHNMKGIGNPDDLKQIMHSGNKLYRSLLQLSRYKSKAIVSSSDI